MVAAAAHSSIAMCIESSGDGGGAAIVEFVAGQSPRVLAESVLPEARSHGAQLIPAMDRALATANTDSGRPVTRTDISLVLVNSGPGSYTGLRVGQTAAETLAHVLGIPALGVPCLEVMCEQWIRENPLLLSDFSTLVPALDARRDECIAAAFIWDGASLTRLSQDQVLPPERVASLVADSLATSTHTTHAPSTTRIVFGQAAAVYAARFGTAVTVNTAPVLISPASVALAAWRIHGGALANPSAFPRGRVEISYFRPILAQTIAERQQLAGAAQ